MASFSILLILIFLLVFAALLIFPLYRIMQRAGLNPALSFIVLVPLVGYLVVLGILAFSTWPNEPDGYY